MTQPVSLYLKASNDQQGLDVKFPNIFSNLFHACLWKSSGKTIIKQVSNKVFSSKNVHMEKLCSEFFRVIKHRFMEVIDALAFFSTRESMKNKILK